MAEAHKAAQVLQAGQSRRSLLGIGVAALALVISGCSVVPKGPPKTTEKPPEQVPLPGLPIDTQRHRIALLVPLSGPNANVGESIANAANMAIIDTASQKMRLTTYDTATGAADAASRALADGNKLILGPLLSEDTRIVAGIARQARVPLVSFSNDVTVAGNGTYLMGFTPAQSMARIVTYARSQGLKRFSAIAPAGVYGERALSAFVAAVEAEGGTVVATQSFEKSSASLLAAVARVSRAGVADAILVADSARSAAQAVPVLRRNGNPAARILGTELWNADPDLASAVNLRGAWFASVSDGVYNQMAGQYRTRFSKSPYRLGSLGYDAILLVAKVSNGWKTGSVFPLRLLEDRGGFMGLDGAFRFSPNGIAERALEVQEVTAKGATIISPAPKRFVD